MPRRTIDLNGSDWSLGMALPGDGRGAKGWPDLAAVVEWLPAVVPGNVRADLIRAGVLPDLMFGKGPEKAQWVDNHDWWLTRRFKILVSPQDQVHLVLHGIDYVSETYLNGRFLGRHEGMFSPQIYDLTDLLRDDNQLAVRIIGSARVQCTRSSCWEKLLNRIEARLSGLPERFPDRRDTLKCQMGFGWDFAPPLRTMGIWDDASLVISERVYIQDISVRTQLAEDVAVITAHLTVNATESIAAQLLCSVTGETFESGTYSGVQPIEMVAGSNHHVISVTIPGPQVWWPWDHGHPHLYRLTAEIWDGQRLLDSTATSIGVRSVSRDGMRLHINGRPIFARGANWVPADILPGCVTEADYRSLLTMVRQANMNFLRVWGGGLREKQAFYRLCDQLGILVWHEFPFACAFLTRFPRSRNYLQLVDAEVGAIVRTLRNHPSVVLWCGGNEFAPKRNRPLVARLAQATAESDPTRPFLPASPGDGDSHNWRVWHHFQPASAYRQDQTSFATEFGLQAPPDAGTLQRFIPPDELWPPGPSWSCHGAGLQKLWRYARPFLDLQEPSLEQFVEACQRAQAYGLQIAIEHYRRRKAAGCGGVLVWQFNEPWPAVSWALVDYYRRPKLAYDMVRRSYAPLFISLALPLRPLRAGDRLSAPVWVINDLAQEFPGCRWAAVLSDRSGQPLRRQEEDVDIAATSAQEVGTFEGLLNDGGGWRLVCSLRQQGRLIAANEYDLAVHDDGRPTIWQRLRSVLGELALPR